MYDDGLPYVQATIAMFQSKSQETLVCKRGLAAYSLRYRSRLLVREYHFVGREASLTQYFFVSFPWQLGWVSRK